MGHQPELQIEQRKLLDLHLELVLKENERSNLTRIVDWQQGQLLHIEDSLVGLQEFEDAPSGRAADLGSGGGFPGIPLAIVSGRPIMLVDSVTKKTIALGSHDRRVRSGRSSFNLYRTFRRACS